MDGRRARFWLDCREADKDALCGMVLVSWSRVVGGRSPLRLLFGLSQRESLLTYPLSLLGTQLDL